MGKFMVLYNSQVSAAEQMAIASQEEMQAGMDAWMLWAAEASDSIVDLGLPLLAKRRVTIEGVADSNAQVAGYSILEGSDAEAIATLLEKHPHLQMPGTSIDIMEVLPMPGM